MRTLAEPRAIPIHQEGGPDLTIVPGIVPYYTEVLSAVAGKDMPEGQFVAVAATYGASFSQPEYNKPVNEAVKVARGLDVAAGIIAIGSEVPIMGLASFAWRAGLTAPDSRLQIIQKNDDREAMSVEADSSVPVLRGDKWSGEGQLYSGGATYRDGDPERMFAVDPPSLVITDAKRPNRQKLIEEIEKADTPHHDGILAVGEKPVAKLLEVIAEDDLGDEHENQTRFSRSKALLILAYFREHGHQLAPSKADFIREAGRRAVSALIAGTAMPLRDSRRERTTLTGRIVKRLGAIDFDAGDYEPIVDEVIRNMEADGSRESFDTLASMRGRSVEEYVKRQAASFMMNLLGVEVG